MSLVVEPITMCRLVSRLNRFVALVEAGNGLARAHLNNTGRLTRLFEPGVGLLCTPRSGGSTSYTVVAVEDPSICGGKVIVIDTRVQVNVLARAIDEGLIGWARGCRVSGREPRAGRSRLDLKLECPDGTVLVEAKSAVMILEGLYAGYPDPPSPRGRRHVVELSRLVEKGFRALLVFIATTPCINAVRVYWEADSLLASLLADAVSRGVEVKAVLVSANHSGYRLEAYLAADNLPVIL